MYCRYKHKLLETLCCPSIFEIFALRNAAHGRDFRANHFWVIVAQGSHPFPSRTRKLSPAAPMVLPARVGGRVGRRPIKTKAPASQDDRGFLVLNSCGSC